MEKEKLFQMFCDSFLSCEKYKELLVDGNKPQEVALSVTRELLRINAYSDLIYEMGWADDFVEEYPELDLDYYVKVNSIRNE